MTIASLMVRLGITGEAEVKKGLAETREEIKSVDRASNSATPSVHSMAGALRAMAAAGALFVAAQVAQKIGDGIATASKASVEYEALTARLEVLTGSAQATAEKLKFMQEVANPSNFTFKQLAEASVTLEAFGLRTERVLPSLAKLGMAFAADNEHLRELTRLYGRLAQGDFPDMEVLSAFGLNKAQFKAQGIEFDNKGKLMSSAKEALDALERIIEQKYGGIFDKMKNTASAKLGSLTDAWEKFVRIVGDGINRVAAPAIERLTELLNGLTSTGILADMIDRMATSIEKMFSSTRSEGFQQGLASILGNVLAFTSYVPEYFRIMGENIVKIFTWIGNSVLAIVEKVSGKESPKRKAYEDMMATIQEMEGPNNRWDEWFGPSRITKEQAEKMRAMARAKFPGIADPFDASTLNLSPFPDFRGTGGQYGDALKMFRQPETGIPEPSGGWGKVTAEETEKQTETLKSIERSSREAADALSLRRQTLGGGELAGLGVTAAELQGRVARNSIPKVAPGFSSTNVPGQGLEKHIARLIEEYLRTSGVTQLRRN